MSGSTSASRGRSTAATGFACAQPFFIAWRNTPCRNVSWLATVLLASPSRCLATQVLVDQLRVDALQRAAAEERGEVLAQHDRVVLQRRRLALHHLLEMGDVALARARRHRCARRTGRAASARRPTCQLALGLRARQPAGTSGERLTPSRRRTWRPPTRNARSRSRGRACPPVPEDCLFRMTVAPVQPCPSPLLESNETMGARPVRSENPSSRWEEGRGRTHPHVARPRNIPPPNFKRCLVLGLNRSESHHNQDHVSTPDCLIFGSTKPKSRSHNPKVAGSNPAPAIRKALETGPFLVTRGIHASTCCPMLPHR